MMKMYTERCRLCNSQNLQEALEIKNHMFTCGINRLYKQIIVCCDDCQFVTTLNVLEDKELNYLYSIGDDYTNYSSQELEKPNYIDRVKKSVNKIKLFNLQFSSILDIGASTGLFLNEISRSFDNVKLAGIETSIQGCRTAKERYNINLIHDTFENFSEYNNEKFDLICACHVLEHIKDINQFMDRISKMSNKYIYIEVPSLNQSMQSELYGFFAEEHINYFTTYSLCQLMKKYGYESVHIDIDYMCQYKISNGFPMISAIFKKAENIPNISKPIVSSFEILKCMNDYCLNEIERINEILHQLDDNMPIAVWGASYQLEHLLANTNLIKKNIICIIDNSSVHQKLKIEIDDKIINVISPDIIDQYNIEKIIISTSSSQQAIYDDMLSRKIANKALLLY